MSYRSATIGGVGHLGTTTYDGDKGIHVPPEQSLCGIESEAWSVREPRFEQWAHRRAGSVCATCDRTAVWQLLRQGVSKW